MKPKNILYGTAYYYEYLSEDRLDKDIAMMKDANINVVRIGESTWGTYEKQDGVFDFSPIDIVLDAMYQAHIHVIVGTPTYAIPTWLAQKYPEVMVRDNGIQVAYGKRQEMDITSPIFLYYAERIIRNMISHVANHPAIIGYQIDNETKYYGTSSSHVQIGFKDYIKDLYQGDLDKFNDDFGLNYWSNRINAWEDFPSMDGSINGSLNAEFDKYRRNLVTNYLQWQYNLVSEYRKDDQFITHNFDFGWRGYSYGIREENNHYDVSDIIDITGIDSYHPSRSKFTGAEISFTGDEARTTKHQSYLVLETQAQAYKQQVPYPGQLRLAAYSHLASGAGMIEYWHWHSIHNSFETYWKGILSHDFQSNPIYDEVSKTGSEFKRLSSKLINMTIKAKVVFLMSNQSLTGTKEFPYSENKNYNDLFRSLYDQFYRLNIRTDLTDEAHIDLNQYKLVVVPSLYSATDDFLESLNKYVANGGHIIYTFRSGFSNEHLKVRTEVQPGIISSACGMHYEMFVNPEPDDCQLVPIANDLNTVSDVELHDWMELLIPDTAEILAKYSSPEWKNYAAITKNHFGKGSIIYIGCYPSTEVLYQLIQSYATELNLITDSITYPIIIKHALTNTGKPITFYLNYSKDVQTISQIKSGIESISGKNISNNLTLKPWDIAIIEEDHHE